RDRRRPARHTRTPPVPIAMALARRPARVPDRPAQPAVERRASLPISGVAGEHPTRAPQCRSAAAGLIGQEILIMFPLTLPIWLAGIWYYLFSEKGKPFRVLGWARLVTMAVIMIMNPRVYYAWPAFPLLFAAGGVLWESWLTATLAAPRLQAQWIKPAWAALMVLFGAVFAPFAVPVLPVETYIRYSQALGFEPPRIETHNLGPLPQIYADQFGWEEMVATVAKIYNGLPPDVRPKTAIFGQNYGQAGAVDLFGPKYGLPNAISGHQ